MAFDPRIDQRRTQQLVDQRTQQLAALDKFIARWQQQQTPLTSEQRVMVYALYERRDPHKPWSDFGTNIGPVLCSSHEQQDAFQKLWAQYTRDDALEDVTEHQPVQEEKSPAPNRRWMLRTFLALVILVLWLRVAWYGWHLPMPPPDPPVASKPPSTQSITPPAESAPHTAIPPLRTVPRREPPPGLSISIRDQRAAQRVRNAVFAVTALLLLALNGLLWWRHRIVIKRLDAHQTWDRRRSIRLATSDLAHTLAPSLRETVNKEHFQPAGRGRIDWPQSVRTSARQLGYLQLKHKQRLRQMDVVLVTDARHARDQASWLVGGLRDALRQAALAVHYYDFDHHPERVWLDGNRTQRPQPLVQLIARHPGAIVIVVVEHTVMFYRFSHRVQPWLETLKQWPRLELVLLSQPNQDEQDLLRQNDYSYRLLAQPGLIDQLLTTATTIPPLDDKLQKIQDRFDNLGEQALKGSAEAQALLRALRDYLGDDGLHVLAGSAMYPELDGDLLLAVYHTLAKRPDTSLTPHRLFKIASLPWCRQGWLPQWLREALIEDLPRFEYQRLRAFYDDLFSPAPVSQSGILELTLTQPRWRMQIRRAEPDSVFKDPVFARVLLNPKRYPNELKLLGSKVNPQLRETLQLGPPALKLAAASLSVLLAVSSIWYFWGETQVTQAIVTQRQASYSEQTVRIRYVPQAESLVEPIAHGLVALGFQVEQQRSAAVSDNRIQAPPALATQLQRIVSRMSWEASFSILTPDSPPVIDIAAPLLTGAVFWDSVEPDTILPGRYPEQLSVTELAPEEGSASEVVVSSQAADSSPTIDPSNVKPNPEQLSVTELAPEEGSASEVVVSSQAADSSPTIDPSNVKPILPTMVPIPAGTFMMGSPEDEEGRDDDEGPQHSVTLAAFEMAETELTFAEWDRCVQAGACQEVDDEGWGREDRPVINVSWNDAQVYIDWLNQALGLSGANRYRLPSEAEWEYAARAGTTTAYYWGDESQCEYANEPDLAGECDDEFEYTAPVKQFKPNAWGLYDMSGNVWEWVEDCWHRNYENAPSDGSPWLEENEGDCDRRALRGGSWVIDPRNLRSANRFRFARGGAGSGAGFRLARTL